MRLTVRSGIVAILLAVGSICFAQAQIVDFQKERQPVVKIHDLWRFHTGDDPDSKLGWAKPGFDDSSWKLLRSDEPWSAQGYPELSGFAWYRFQVILPASQQPMALYIPNLHTSYEVFAGGRLIGQLGGLPPHEKVLHNYDIGTAHLVALPNDLTSRGGPLTIAIRVWHWPHWPVGLGGGGPQGAIRIGDAELLDEWRTLQIGAEFRVAAAQNILLCGYLLAGLAGLGLFLMRRGEREYLWFAAAELASAAMIAWDDHVKFDPAWFQGWWTLDIFLIIASGICFLTFVMALLKQRRTWLYWIAFASILASALPVLGADLNWVSFPAAWGAGSIADMPFHVCVPLLVLFSARRGNLDARLLLGPVALSYGVTIVVNTLGTLATAGLVGWETYTKLFHLFSWPFPVSAPNIADFLMQISILAILVLRFARTRRDEERHASELEAARAVQQVLVPEEIPAVPGFRIESVYKPAGQVGGDFFQIIPLPDGGLLAVIGDVSGKGMPAAMTVSLLVGTFRTLAHYTHSPGEILAAMNRRMLARSHGGFTTCLVLHAGADGGVTIANAGHISPYRNGAEMVLENGLPLGLSEDATYAESIFSLHENEQLTLVTDGVVEARGKGGELFGFTRTQDISREDAERIAQTAQAFGQDDDITVLTLCHVGVGAVA